MRSQKSGKYSCYEFEKKFLLEKLPSELVNSQDYKQIEDTYYVGTNLRLRIVRSSKGEILDRKFTQKLVPPDLNLACTSITNIYLSENEVKFLSRLPGIHLKKKRYKHTWNNKTFSVDEFLPPYENLVIAEFEFEFEEEMNQFTPPFLNWKDVSLNVEYSGGFLAQKS